MDTTPKYYICRHCGNLVEALHETGVEIHCCGEPMELVGANTTDAAQEKHVPACTVNGSTVEVQVGSVEHPMTEEHHIGWIWLQTEKGGQRRKLSHTEAPKATFTVAPGDKAIAVYEWCNLHGIWKADL